MVFALRPLQLYSYQSGPGRIRDRKARFRDAVATLVWHEDMWQESSIWQPSGEGGKGSTLFPLRGRLRYSGCPPVKPAFIPALLSRGLPNDSQDFV